MIKASLPAKYSNSPINIYYLVILKRFNDIKSYSRNENQSAAN